MTFLRSKQYAATYFKTKGGPATELGAIPRYKFMFYANFIPSAPSLKYPDKTNLDYNRLGTYEDGISFKIHTIDKPKINLTAVELNQYNRKRYAYTKVEYQPLTIKIHDTVDDIPLKMWRDYFTYYFGDSRKKTDSVYQQKILDPLDMGWGFNPQGSDYSFFKKIELYALFGKKYTQINYINPKIVSIDWGNFDTSGTDLSELTITMNYEAVEYAQISQAMSTKDFRKFGFDISKTVEAPGSIASKSDIKSWTPGSKNSPSLITQLSKLATIATDVSRSISSSFAIANTALNMFSGSSINSMGQTGLSRIVGQASGVVYASSAISGIMTGQLLTDPSSTSSFISGSASMPNPVGGGASSDIASMDFGLTSLSDADREAVITGGLTAAETAQFGTSTPGF